jgi:hypothetical protein
MIQKSLPPAFDGRSPSVEKLLAPKKRAVLVGLTAMSRPSSMELPPKMTDVSRFVWLIPCKPRRKKKKGIVNLSIGILLIYRLLEVKNYGLLCEVPKIMPTGILFMITLDF